MDDFNIEKIPSDTNHDEPIPFDDSDTDSPSISHSPLNLGGGETTEAPKVEMTAPATAAVPVEKKSTEQASSPERITGVRTFFTKTG